jgi:nucleoside-diphosphate-sugar epimerase
MQIFVTGATGVLGKAVIPRLIADGHTVRALSRARVDPRGRPRGSDNQAESRSRHADRWAHRSGEELHDFAGCANYAAFKYAHIRLLVN